MNIGITCYPTHGGSGVVAVELGVALANRGHDVHFISYSVPFRLRDFHQNIYFHEVQVNGYPLFKYPPYALSLANKMAEVCSMHKLDVLHVHYAIPHALSAFLCKQMLGDQAPKIVTTLHGTDITLVGADQSFWRIIKFGIEESDGVTAVSEYLRDTTLEEFETQKHIEVIHNFVDTERFSGNVSNCDKRRYAPNGEKILLHASNFRPVKRVGDVVRIFARVREQMPARLLLIGEGPERMSVQRLVRDLKIEDDVFFLGTQDYVENLLGCADLFLIPSEQESFGLVALEAMSCGVPVLGSSIGGLPEVVVHGQTGYLCPVGEIQMMTDHALKILSDDSPAATWRTRARQRATEMFEQEKVVTEYERFYERFL